MALKTVKESEVNQVSDDIKKYLKERPLKPGQTVQYRLLGGVKNVDPTRHGGTVLYPSVVTIPLTGIIYDQEAGANVVIGVIQEVMKNGTPVFRQKMVMPTKDNPNFWLSGDDPEDIEAYEVMELLSTNAASPYRSTAVTATFERVDEVAESTKRSNKRNYLIDSINAIRSWTPAELRVMGAGYNVPTTLETAVIKERLETIAEANPELFYKALDNPETKAKSVIIMGKEAGVLNYIAHENKWVFTDSGEIVALLDRREGVDELTQLAQVLLSAANGAKIRAQIERLVTAKNKK